MNWIFACLFLFLAIKIVPVGVQALKEFLTTAEADVRSLASLYAEVVSFFQTSITEVC
jgi:uncharacterized membrane protein